MANISLSIQISFTRGLTLVFIGLWPTKVLTLTIKKISNGLELHWVQGGPIVTLARLFPFLFIPYSNCQNWPKTWPKIMAEIQAHNTAYTTLYKFTRLGNLEEKVKN